MPLSWRRVDTVKKAFRDVILQKWGMQVVPVLTRLDGIFATTVALQAGFSLCIICAEAISQRWILPLLFNGTEMVIKGRKPPRW